MRLAIPSHSRHPYSQALAALASARIVFDELTERPGAGLGARAYTTINDDVTVVLSKDRKCIVSFDLADRLRAGTSEAIVAAVQMSASSIIVVANALRLDHRGQSEREPATPRYV